MMKILVIEEKDLDNVVALGIGWVKIRTILEVLESYELKDVAKLEAVVQKSDWHFLNEKRVYSVIADPPNVKPGDKVFVIPREETDGKEN